MSLINDMLNDLEKRRSEQPAQKEDLGWLTSSGSRPKKTMSLYVWMLPLLLLVVLMIIGQQYLAKSAVNEADKILKRAAAKPVGGALKPIVKNVIAEVVISPLELKAVEFYRVGDEAMVQFSFNQKPDYQLELSKGELVVTLSAIASQIPQQLAAVEPPIKAMTYRQQEGDLIVVLGYEGNIQYRSQLIAEPAYQLQVFVKGQTIKPSTSVITTAAKKQFKDQVREQNISRLDVKKSVPLSFFQKDKRVVQEAKSDIRLNRREDAVRRLGQFLELYSGAPQASLLLAELLIEKKQLDEAQRVLDKITISSADSTERRRLQAHIFVLTDKTGQAINLLLTKQPEIKHATAYYELLAMAAQREKQYELSVQVYKNLLRFDSSVGAWWLGLAISQDLYGLKADARGNFQQAIRTGRISQSLRDYALRRYNALAGAENDPLIQSSQVKTHVE